MATVRVNKNVCKVDPLYQWNLNQDLVIFGLSLSAAPEVHFAHVNDSAAIVRQSTMDAAGVVRVKVPNSQLQRAGKLFAYVCTDDGSIFRTRYKIPIQIESRPRPADYTYQPEVDVYSLAAVGAEVVTLDAGEEATVEKVLEDGRLTYVFRIPRGEKGEKGEPGRDGKDGKDAEVTANSIMGALGYDPGQALVWAPFSEEAENGAHIVYLPDGVEPRDGLLLCYTAPAHGLNEVIIDGTSHEMVDVMRRSAPTNDMYAVGDTLVVRLDWSINPIAVLVSVTPAEKAQGGVELTAESIEAALSYKPLDGSGGTAGQIATSDGEGGLTWADPPESEASASIIGTPLGVKCKEFAALLKGKDRVESFLFFTDPHLATSYDAENKVDPYATDGAWEEKFLSNIELLKQCYEATPTSFILCGGDWLELHQRDEACFRLGYIDGFMRSNFHNYYSVVGNHDHNGITNGKTYPAEDDIGTLPVKTVRNLMMRNEANAYYAFDGIDTRFYVLDSGAVWWGMDNNKWPQIAWLADKLKTEDKEHSAVIVHASHEDSNGSLEPTAFTTNFTALCQAYNNAETITLNNVEYDFTGCTGRVYFVLAGHKHAYNINERVNNIPIISTHNFQKGGGSFDLCMVDYDAEELHMVRVGSGTDRAVSIAENDPETPDAPSGYTNQIPLSVFVNSETGETYTNETGYKEDTRLGTGSGIEVALAGYCTTGFIPVKNGDVIRLKGMTYTDAYSAYCYYNSAFTFSTASVIKDTASVVIDGDVATITVAKNHAYIRICSKFNNAIVTVNEEIVDN